MCIFYENTDILLTAIYIEFWGELCSWYVKVDWWTGVASLAPPPHFLDSLACLFLGGAHFKHIVSTVRETRHAVSDGKQNTERCRRTPSCCLVARRRVQWGVTQRHKAKKKQQFWAPRYYNFWQLRSSTQLKELQFKRTSWTATNTTITQQK